MYAREAFRICPWGSCLELVINAPKLSLRPLKFGKLGWFVGYNFKKQNPVSQQVYLTRKKPSQLKGYSCLAYAWILKPVISNGDFSIREKSSRVGRETTHSTKCDVGIESNGEVYGKLFKQWVLST